jgi:hypothetical protein
VIKHEVLHDQLAAAIEKVRQRGPTLWAVEQVFRVDLDHWQPAAISTEGLSLPSVVLLLGEQRLASDQPLLA